MTKCLLERIDTFSRRSFLTEEVSGRIVQLDEIAKSSAKVSWTSEPEFVPEVVCTTGPEVTTRVVETPVNPVI